MVLSDVCMCVSGSSQGCYIIRCVMSICGRRSSSSGGGDGPELFQISQSSPAPAGFGRSYRLKRENDRRAGFPSNSVLVGEDRHVSRWQNHVKAVPERWWMDGGRNEVVLCKEVKIASKCSRGGQRKKLGVILIKDSLFICLDNSNKFLLPNNFPIKDENTEDLKIQINNYIILCYPFS